jgi:hypothetical protein
MLWKVLRFLIPQSSASCWNVIQHHLLFSMMLLLMICMTGLLGGFLAFHLFLIFNNTTTNEYKKWKDIKAWHKEVTFKYESSLLLRNSNAGDEEGAQLKGRVAGPGLLPANACDMGRLANVYEVIFPRSLRQTRNHQHEE